MKVTRVVFGAALAAAFVGLAGCDNRGSVPPSTTSTTTAPSTEASTGAATALTAQQAQTLLDQATQYIKERKWDLADKSLTQLEAHKASLPATIADQLPKLRSTVNTGKATGEGGLKLPGT